MIDTMSSKASSRVLWSGVLRERGDSSLFAAFVVVHPVLLDHGALVDDGLAGRQLGFLHAFEL
jgi:hypothetical protein